MRHPNVLAIHGAGTHHGRVGLWCDLIEEITLGEKLRREGPLELEPALDFVIDLAGALASVHAAGLVHCDVKSSNVMLGPDNRIILMDFGSGKDAQEGTGKREMSFDTPMFMAPELFRGQEPHPPSDIYSLGVLLFYMLSNRFPIEAKTFPEIIAHHVEGQRLALNEAKPGLAKPLRELVEARLSADPEGRPSPARLVSRLKWIKELPVRRIKQRLQVGLVTVLCLGVLLASWGWFTAKRETTCPPGANRNAGYFRLSE